MLKVYIGEHPNGLGLPDAWFDTVMDKSYIETDWSREVIKAIDKSDVFDKNVVVSPIFGGMSIKKLSSGVKNLILAKYYPELIINWAYMGRNCMPFLMNIAMEQDVPVSGEIYYSPYKYGYKGDIEILNDGSIVSDSRAFWKKFLEFEEVYDEGDC